MTMTKTFRLLALSTALGLTFSPAWADVTIRYLASQGSLRAHELAWELGYFEGTGITLENVGYSTGGPASLVALAGGSTEIADPATPALLNAIAAGNNLVAAYPANGINDQVQSVFLVPEDSPIRSLEDIAGKTIAVNTLGAHLDYVVREGLHQTGLPADAANLITVPGPQLDQVLRSGQVDVAAFGYWQTTFLGAAEKAGGLRAVFDDTDVLGEIAGGFITFDRAWTEAHPEETRAFIDASTRALEFARTNLEETRAIFARVLEERGENPEVAQYFTGYGVRAGGKSEERDIQFWIDVLEREGKVEPGKLVARDILYTAGASSPASQ